MTAPRPTSALAALARCIGLAPTERTDVHAYVAAIEGENAALRMRVAALELRLAYGDSEARDG